jgi:transcriptional regulator with XRE-family HTH domain
MGNKEKSIGECVREAREAKGWSQARLARQIGLSQATLHKIESGISKNSRYIPVIWAQVGLSLDDLNRRLRQAGMTTAESHFVVNAERKIIGGSYPKRARVRPADDKEDIFEQFCAAVAAKLTRPTDYVDAFAVPQEAADAVLGTAQELKSGGHGIAIMFLREDGTELVTVMMNPRLAELLCARLDTVVKPPARVQSDDLEPSLHAT